MVFTVRDLNVRGPVRSARQATAVVEISVWRWLALLAAVVAIAYDKIHRWYEWPALTSVLERHGSTIAPSQAVLGLWSTMLVGWLIYAVVQLGEQHQRIAAHERVSRSLVAAAVLASLMQATLGLDAIWFTAAMALALTVVLGSGYAALRTDITAGRLRGWIAAPFAIGFGFAGVIAMAAIDATITSAGCPSSAPAVALLIGGGLIASRIGLHHRDPVVPALAAWLITSTCANPHVATNQAGGALLSGGLCAVIAVVIASTCVRMRDPGRAVRPRRPTPGRAYARR